MSRTRVRLASAVAAGLAGVVLLSGCSVFEDLTSSNDAGDGPSASPSATETAYPSQFTRDGTFQSHYDVDGLDFVYTLFPTKSTPRTNEWYPKGRKYFSFTFQAYDLDRGLRDPFATKRKVYLDRIQVTSSVVTEDGTSSRQPYRLDAVAKNVTFDPEPVSTRYGMLITSPKGAFELRNQAIEPTTMDTRGIDLRLTATVWIQQSPGSSRYTQETIRQKVPISIFASDEKTEAQDIPINAN